MQPDGKPVVLVKDFKSALNPLQNDCLALNEIRKIVFRRDFNCVFTTVPDNECETQLQIFKPDVTEESLETNIQNAAYAYEANSFLPVSGRKLVDTQKLLSKVALPPNVTFYDSLVA